MAYPLMTMDEFELIQHYFVRPELQNIALSTTYSPPILVALGPGDDCALLDTPVGYQWAVSNDTMVAGTHFPRHLSPYAMATRALAASVSDLAAMGASPVAFSLSLTLPPLDNYALHTWLQGFSDGLAAMAKQCCIALIGGDTSQGNSLHFGQESVIIGVHVMGLVPKDQALLRSGAQVNDNIYVSGYLGDAAAGLHGLKHNPNNTDYLTQRFCQPTPRLALGQWLVGKASAAIDVSDGLLQDAKHILTRSQTHYPTMGMDIQRDAIPVSGFLQDKFGKEQAYLMALTGGEDFELCFTLAPHHHQALMQFAEQVELNISLIGQVQALGHLRLYAQQEQIPLPDKLGWTHF